MALPGLRAIINNPSAAAGAGHTPAPCIERGIVRRITQRAISFVMRPVCAARPFSVSADAPRTQEWSAGWWRRAGAAPRSAGPRGQTDGRVVAVAGCVRG